MFQHLSIPHNLYYDAFPASSVGILRETLLQDQIKPSAVTGITA